MDKNPIILNFFDSLPKKEITDEFLNIIDMNDTEYCFRTLESDRECLEYQAMKENIKTEGMFNAIILQEKDNGKYRIISGYLRCLAFLELKKEGKVIVGEPKAKIVPSDVDPEYLCKVTSKIDSIMLLSRSISFFFNS
ncbi:ParB N-terminal domain-containing protein [bacterium]|nr:ParB N-terminal domain-containing protein [bacterium]